VGDVPEWQELIAQGLVAIDPSTKINPFGEDFAVKPDGTPFTFACTYVFLRIDSCAQGEKMIKSFIERAGGIYLGFDPDLDVNKQISFVEDCISVTHPDALLVHAVNEGMTAPVIDRAFEAGIPTYNVDIETFAENKITYVHHLMQGPGGCDQVGQAFVNKANAMGYTADNPMIILEIWGFHEWENHQLRHQGFHTSIDKSPNIQVIESIDCQSTDELAASITMDEVSAHPEIKGIYNMCGGGAGVVSALEGLDKLLPVSDPDHIFLALNDMDTVVLEQIEGGKVDAVGTHQFYDLADVCLQMMFTGVVLGQTVPKDVIVPMYVVDPSNINSLLLLGVPVYPRMPTAQWDLWPPSDPSPAGSLMLYPDMTPWQFPTPTKELRMELVGY
jgi:ABC-type sugar transport system substrate-binding protein